VVDSSTGYVRQGLRSTLIDLRSLSNAWTLNVTSIPEQQRDDDVSAASRRDRLRRSLCEAKDTQSTSAATAKLDEARDALAEQISACDRRP
jgi:hypothetical protein